MGQNYKGTNKMKGDESVHLQCSTVTGLDKTSMRQRSGAGAHRHMCREKSHEAKVSEHPGVSWGLITPQVLVKWKETVGS